MNMLKEDIGEKGYVVGFEGLVKYISALIPTEEVIAGALRTQKSAYPVIAIREAVANALIHQDFLYGCIKMGSVFQTPPQLALK